jgi:hypothetical protein
LVHVTVEPAVTVTGFGEYALVVRVDDPAVIETVIPEPPVDTTGVGDVIGVEDPQPKDEPARSASMKRTVGIRMFSRRSKTAPHVGAYIERRICVVAVSAFPVA